MVCLCILICFRSANSLEALATTDGTNRVPWASIIKAPEDFIAAEYLPNYEIMDKEPSHLPIAKVRQLLRFWLERQSAGKITFRWKAVLENGEMIAAKAPGKGIRPMPAGPSNKGKSSKVHKGKKTTGNSRQKGKSDDLLELSASDDEPAPVVKQKKKTRPKPVKKSKVVVDSDLETLGEEFNFEEPLDRAPPAKQKKKIRPRPVKKSKVVVDSDLETPAEEFNLIEPFQINSSCDEPVNEPAPMLTGENDEVIPVSPELVPLWKAFMGQLPDEYRSWSPTRLDAQFQVFRGWVGSSGAFRPEGYIGKGSEAEENALTPIGNNGVTEKPEEGTVSGDVAHLTLMPHHGAGEMVEATDVGVHRAPSNITPYGSANDVTSLAPTSVMACYAADEILRFTLPEETPSYILPASTIQITSRKAAGEITSRIINSDNSANGPSSQPKTGYSTPRLKNLFDSFKELTSGKPSENHVPTRSIISDAGPEIPRMSDVLRNSPVPLPIVVPGAFVNRHVMPSAAFPGLPQTAVGGSSAMPSAQSAPSAPKATSSLSVMSGAVDPILTQEPNCYTPPLAPSRAGPSSAMPPAVTPMADHTAVSAPKAAGSPSNQAAITDGVQTRKRKADEDGIGSRKRVTKAPNKLPVTITKSSEKAPTRGKKPDVATGNPPKRGRGRPKKAGT